MRFRINTSVIYLMSMAGILLGTTQPTLAQDFLNDPLIVVLSDRHSQPPLAKLQEIAGGRQALIARLKELRLSDNPQLSYAAEALLVDNFSDDRTVLPLLIEDAEHAGRAGHAKLIAMRLSASTEPSPGREQARTTLLGALILRAEREPKMAHILQRRLQEGLAVPPTLQADALRLRGTP